jgi:antitoxin CptB
MAETETGEAQTIRRKRLFFRAQRRGFKEVDLIFGTYAATALAGMDKAALDAFEALMDVPDQEVYRWLQGHEAPPPVHDTHVLAQMKALCARKEPTWKS